MDTSKHKVNVSVPIEDYDEMISKLSNQTDSDMLVDVVLKSILSMSNNSGVTHVMISELIDRIKNDLKKVGYKFSAEGNFDRFFLEKI
ncbi:hypothetical protein [Sphingobacterium detergens]|uniref:hypothetical protein n=1 Tax=Sphingobacterium detergens TaxID=1145106 RepID=UPI003AAE900D